MKPNAALAYRPVPAFLKSLRLKAKLTQVQLAERLGKPQSFVARIEAGTRRVDVVEFVVLARAFGEKPFAAFRKLIEQLTI